VDSISQFVLGAAIGEATLGSRLGRRAMLVGGLIGTLPDLDVLIQYSDAVESFTYHRSWSHSLLVLALISPVVAYLLHRVYPARWLTVTHQSNSSLQRPSYWRWFVCVLLALITHPVLDGFTVYGTQLFWPLPVPPVALASVFIIDPLYTLPLIIALVIAYRKRHLARTAVLVGLLLSSFYLGLTLMSQQYARSVALQSLEQQNFGTQNVLLAPLPFSLLWRVVSMDGDTYHEGFYSLLDENNNIQFTAYDSNRAIIDEFKSHWPIARLDWFTGSMISASREGDQLIINDLRMGSEASYIFRFRVGQWNDSGFQALESTDMPIEFNGAHPGSIFKRIWDEGVTVKPI